MRKIFLVMLTVIAPAISTADILPPGCFVTNSAPQQCYLGIGTPLDQGSVVLNSLTYGGVVARLMSDTSFLSNLADTYLANYNSCVVTVNSQADECNGLLAAKEANRQEWITYGNGQAALVAARNTLIKKLRKKCGAPCKKIK